MDMALSTNNSSDYRRQYLVTSNCCRIPDGDDVGFEAGVVGVGAGVGLADGVQADRNTKTAQSRPDNTHGHFLFMFTQP